MEGKLISKVPGVFGTFNIVSLEDLSNVPDVYASSLRYNGQLVKYMAL